jgi:hypothetical protein
VCSGFPSGTATRKLERFQQSVQRFSVRNRDKTKTWSNFAIQCTKLRQILIRPGLCLPAAEALYRVQFHQEEL